MYPLMEVGLVQGLFISTVAAKAVGIRDSTIISASRAAGTRRRSVFFSFMDCLLWKIWGEDKLPLFMCEIYYSTASQKKLLQFSNKI